MTFIKLTNHYVNIDYVHYVEDHMTHCTVYFGSGSRDHNLTFKNDSEEYRALSHHIFANALKGGPRS